MKINRDIQNALREAIRKAGTQVLLSKKCGIRQNYFSKYLTGEVNSIEHENWLKLYPYLQEFLPEHMREKKNMDTALPMDEKILLECYRRFTSDEKEALIKEVIIKEEVKNMKKTG